jgi:tetratricopeptide (TPR) repeat protein
VWALACFAGGAPLGAVEDVLGALDVPPASAVDVVSRLVDRSLVAIDATADGELRYRLLDSVRAYGAARLEEAGLGDAARGAHAAWYAAAADRAVAEVRGPDQARHLAFARRERANVDAALAWAGVADPAVALRIASGFGWAWVVIGEGAIGADRLRGALEAAGESAPPAARVSAWCSTAWLEGGVNVERAEAAAASARAIAAGEPSLEAPAALAEAFVRIQQGRPKEALDLLRECRSTFAAQGDVWSEGAACILTAHAAFFLADVSTAGAAVADAERLVRASDDAWGLDHLEATLGRVALASGQFAEAAAHLEEAIDAARRLGFATSEGYHQANLGRARELSGDPTGAATAFERAIEIGRQSAEPRLAALARVRLGHVLHETGARERARTEITAADAWFRASGGGDGARLAAALVAIMDAEDGVAGASDRMQQLVAEAQAAADGEVEALLVTVLGG